VIAALPPEDQPEYGSAKELPRPCFRYWPLRSNVNALAWGYESHRIVAEIAEQFSNPKLRTEFGISLQSKTARPSLRCQHGPTRFDHSTPKRGGGTS
jgi:hypothetical protein